MDFAFNQLDSGNWFSDAGFPNDLVDLNLFDLHFTDANKLFFDVQSWNTIDGGFFNQDSQGDSFTLWCLTDTFDDVNCYNAN